MCSRSKQTFLRERQTQPVSTQKSGHYYSLITRKMQIKNPYEIYPHSSQIRSYPKRNRLLASWLACLCLIVSIWILFLSLSPDSSFLQLQTTSQESAGNGSSSLIPATLMGNLDSVLDSQIQYHLDNSLQEFEQ